MSLFDFDIENVKKALTARLLPDYKAFVLEGWWKAKNIEILSFSFDFVLKHKPEIFITEKYNFSIWKTENNEIIKFVLNFYNKNFPFFLKNNIDESFVFCDISGVNIENIKIIFEFFHEINSDILLVKKNGINKILSDWYIISNLELTYILEYFLKYHRHVFDLENSKGKFLLNFEELPRIESLECVLDFFGNFRRTFLLEKNKHGLNVFDSLFDYISLNDPQLYYFLTEYIIKHFPEYFKDSILKRDSTLTNLKLSKRLLDVLIENLN